MIYFLFSAGSLDETGNQVGVPHEYVFLFGVFDENESKHEPKGHGNHVKYTINGYTEGSLPGESVHSDLTLLIYAQIYDEVHNQLPLLCPGVSLCAFASVSLHLLGMSSDPEVFSVHMNGQVLQQNGHKVSSVGLISGSTATASMVALHTGRWMLSSHTVKHMEGTCCSTHDITRSSTKYRQFLLI